MRDDHLSIGKENALQLAVKAVNDIAKTDGLVPTLLVLGTHSKLSVPLTSDIIAQKERTDAINAARKEFSKITSRRRVDSAREQNKPAAALKFTDIFIGQEVLFYRVISVEEWVGQFLAQDILRKHVLLDFNGKFSNSSTTRIKLYVKVEPMEDNIISKSDIIGPNFIPIKAFHNVMKYIRLDVGVAHRVAETTKATGFEVHPDYINFFNSANNGLKKGPIALFYQNLDQSTLRIQVYVDFSFRSNIELSSQPRYIALLCNATNRSHVLKFVSQKCQRVTRSVL